MFKKLTKNQVVEKGMLVDLNQYLRVNESGYRYPLACTSSVWAIIERTIKNPKYLNDYVLVIWYILHKSRCAIIEVNELGCFFEVEIIGARPKKKYILKIKRCLDEQGSPVLTIMSPDEN